MKRKGDRLANSITKHLKDEPLPLFDFHSMESVAGSLADVDFAALMVTSKNVYATLKQQRVVRILGTRINNIFICKAYLAMKNGIITLDMLKAWLEKHHWSSQQEAHNQVSIYQIIYNIQVPVTWARNFNAYDLLMYERDVEIYENRVSHVIETMWRYFMHEDDIAKVVDKMLRNFPSKNFLEYVLSALAMWQYPPELLRSLKQQHFAKVGAQRGFKALLSIQRTCPNIGYLESVKTIIPRLTSRILSRKNHIELHRSILECPPLLAYFVENAGHAKVLGIVCRITKHIPETFPLAPKEIGTHMLSRRGAVGQHNAHLWNYVLQEPTKALAQTLLHRANASMHKTINPKYIWKCLSLIGTKKNKFTGTNEPKSVKSIAGLLKPRIKHPKFVNRFLRCFGSADYRRLVIELWPENPPKELLDLELPCAATDPSPILYYETLRLRLRMTLPIF